MEQIRLPRFQRAPRVARIKLTERGRGFFLFTDVEAFRAHTNPLVLPWESVNQAGDGNPEILGVNSSLQPNNTSSLIIPPALLMPDYDDVITD